MLGSAADAEDVLQKTWLQWRRIDLATVQNRRAFLVRITTRQALDRMRVLGRRKETYTGPWLPEPLLTAPDVAEDVELADSVSMAMLLVLETLTPIERAVFVLREVFEFPYDEIAQAVDKSLAAVRQIAHRAREHVSARRPRGATTAAETRAALAAFQHAVQTGDLRNLLDILAPDVIALSDGGGIRQAMTRPAVGIDRVARLLVAHAATLGAHESIQPVSARTRSRTSLASAAVPAVAAVPEARRAPSAVSNRPSARLSTPRAGNGLSPITHGEDHRDRIVVQPADREQQRVDRRLIEPLRVVEQAQQRLVAAISDSNDRVAAPGSIPSTRPSPSPKAARSAWACPAGSASKRSRSHENIRCSAEYVTSASESSPTTRSTRIPPAALSA
ncbi:sigma-70 family RNA polymerase sigma factor [Actinomadura madurae]|uniref:sigma-70 family RNA polymerase sigma factor n=1 Tax=Actinomadura madurae TaxID=1993 RepID=UPI0020D22655|nr:sigma-70 family RNA polymerase sigma factor [Actinomadura madurae]MCQ0003687.1 sigma-70 family RNA polymerase sigma factor [Actinomadura madurae]